MGWNELRCISESCCYTATVATIAATADVASAAAATTTTAAAATTCIDEHPCTVDHQRFCDPFISQPAHPTQWHANKAAIAILVCCVVPADQ